MRYGILADVHGNLFALQAAVGRLREEGVDGWLCAGDLVGYGPHPSECVEVVAELGAACVAGNHELLVLGELPEGRAGRLARETTAWTRGELREDCRSFLARLPMVVTVEDLVMAHGSLASPEEYVTGEAQAAGQLRRLGAEHPGSRLLVVGHTHRPWLYSRERGTVAPGGGGDAALPRAERFLLNPGSVGQSRQREREPRARCMLVDTERRRVRFYAVPYDVAASRQALRRHGLPRDGVHVRPGPLATLERRSRNLLRRSLAATGLSRRRGRRHDLLLDVAGSRPWSACRRVLEPRGRLVLVGAPKGSRLLGPLSHIARVRLASLPGGQTVVFFISKSSGQDLAALAELLEAGTVTPCVERTYPLSEAADALRHLGEGHARGKLVVTMQPR